MEGVLKHRLTWHSNLDMARQCICLHRQNSSSMSLSDPGFWSSWYLQKNLRREFAIFGAHLCRSDSVLVTQPTASKHRMGKEKNGAHTLILMVIFTCTWISWIPPRFLYPLVLKRLFMDNWHGFLKCINAFLSIDQQCQSTEQNNIMVQ